MAARYSLRPRSVKPIEKFQDMKFIPGANNGYTAGRLIDRSENLSFNPNDGWHKQHSEQKDKEELKEESEFDEDESDDDSWTTVTLDDDDESDSDDEDYEPDEDASEEETTEESDEETVLVNLVKIQMTL